jgi:integrase
LLALLGEAKRHRERDWLMLATGFHFGLRVSELTEFTPDDLRDGYLTIQRKKGSNRTRQALPAYDEPLLNFRQPLIDYVAKSIPARPVFKMSESWLRRLMQRYGVAVGIPRHLLHPHILKHSIAMQTIAVAGIEKVRQHLGHKSISSTGAYLKVSDEDASRAVISAVRGVGRSEKID